IRARARLVRQRVGLLQSHVRRGGGDGEGDALKSQALSPASVTFAIARYADGDLAGVKDCILTIQQREFGFPITWEDQPDLHDIAGWYRAGGGDFWVAKDEAGRVVGMIGLRDIGRGMG